MKVKKSWTTVTPTSKALALALFITLPIIAFLFGAKWQKLQDMAIITAEEGKLQLQNSDMMPDHQMRPKDYSGSDEMMYINGTPMPVGL